jgi:hypothetical protein
MVRDGRNGRIGRLGMTRKTTLALAVVLLGAVPAQAQNVGGAGGKGGNATINIYGGNIYLSPKGGDGGAGGGVTRGSPQAPEAAVPGGPSLWNHNGSTMRLEAAGARRRFLYVRPRSGMLAAGAAPGTLLFEGVRRGASYSGVAYVFAGDCGKFPYDVSGVLESETEVVMVGMAPSVSRDTCSIEGYRRDRIVFNQLQAD